YRLRQSEQKESIRSCLTATAVLIAITVQELRRLITHVQRRQLTDLNFHWAWSLWRRHHQANAKRAHYQKRDAKWEFKYCNCSTRQSTIAQAATLARAALSLLWQTEAPSAIISTFRSAAAAPDRRDPCLPPWRPWRSAACGTARPWLLG